MQKIIHYTIIIILTGLLSSCIKTVDDVDLNTEGKKLVLTSFITPNTDTIYAELSSSIPYFDEENTNTTAPKVENGRIKILKGNNTYQMKYDSAEKVYFLPTANTLDIKAGQTYQIQATAKGFKKVEGECTVPYAAPQNLSVERQEKNNELITLAFEFTDIPNEDNYYRMVLYEYTTYSSNDSTWKFNNWYWISGNRINLLSDINKDGTILRARAEVPVYSVSKKIRIILLSVDEHYYNYHDKINQSYYSNPFSEPVIPYTNIKNGLGVFAGYTKTIKDFTITK